MWLNGRLQIADCRLQNAERRLQSADCRVNGEQLRMRFLAFAVRIIHVSAALPKTEEGLHIRRQVLRSGTSAGANYQEACGAESRADFIHKMQIVLKELRETLYWLQVVRAAGMLPAVRMGGVTQESDELIAIVVRSLVTARGNARHVRKG